jgi:nucleotide-binding universal stress UspA family protein
VHVVPRVQQAAVYGAPPVDFLPQQVREERGRVFFFSLFFLSWCPAPTPTPPHPPFKDPVAYEQLIKNAEAFIAARFLPRLLSLSPEPVVHVVKADVDTDSIGNVVCRKAGDLGAAALVMASHTKSRVQEFFLGSVTAYCTHHSPAPVLVVK